MVGYQLSDSLDDTWKFVAMDLLCGGTAGSLGIFIGQPFDLVKIRLQTEPHIYPSALSCFAQTVSKEGFLSLYKGLAAPFFGQFAQNALIFAGESVALRYLEPNMTHHTEISGQTVTNVFLAGSFGGLLQCLVLVPADLIKCKMQVDHSSRKSGSQRPYANSLDCATKIYKADGLAGLYRGFSVTACREVPAFGVYFFVYRWTLKFLNGIKVFAPPPQPATLSPADTSSHHHHHARPSPGLSTLVAGGLAGCASWTCIYPFDVIKSHVQTNTDTKTTAMQTAAKLYKQHGPRIFVRGLGVCLARAFPVNAAVFYVLESLKSRLGLN
jgi:Mitochondrial carrier protein